MRLVGEVIVGGGHRKFIAHTIDEGDVDGGASSMLAFAIGGIGNVTLIANELPHLELNGTWTITVEDFQAETFLCVSLAEPFCKAAATSRCTKAAGKG